MTRVAVLLVAAYALGSLPFGLWLARVQGVDLRETGSGNIGATNVLRSLGRLNAAVVFLLDAGKGALAVLVAGLFVEEPWPVVAAAVAVTCGHVWPVWADFRGGKGVATVAGAYLALAPVGVLLAGVVFVSVAAMSRYVSVASMSAAAVLPLAVLALDERRIFIAGAVVLAALVIWRHRGNAARVVAGTEPRIGEDLLTGRRRGPFIA